MLAPCSPYEGPTNISQRGPWARIWTNITPNRQTDRGREASKQPDRQTYRHNRVSKTMENTHHGARIAIAQAGIPTAPVSCALARLWIVVVVLSFSAPLSESGSGFAAAAAAATGHEEPAFGRSSETSSKRSKQSRSNEADSPASPAMAVRAAQQPEGAKDWLPCALL